MWSSDSRSRSVAKSVAAARQSQKILVKSRNVKAPPTAGSIDRRLHLQLGSSRVGVKRKGQPKPPLQVLDRKPKKASVPSAPPLSW
jgi:hypothetical protein